jgi:hypothetical protein
METREDAVIQLELKYCERCGGLFLRRQEVGEVYCNRCADQVVESRSGRRLKDRSRVPVNLNGRRFNVLPPAGTKGGNV